MKKTTLFFSVLLCAMFCVSFTTQAQESDFDNDGIVDRLDVDDDNDGILDTVECPAIAGAAGPQIDQIAWKLNQYKVFTISANTNGLGYQESGYQEEVFSRGQSLTVLNGASDFSFPASSWTAGSANTSVGTFANGTLSFEDNHLGTDQSITASSPCDSLYKTFSIVKSPCTKLWPSIISSWTHASMSAVRATSSSG